MKSLRILALGAKSVGKSAIVVRFLTKRYIGEYQTDCDILYRQVVNCEDIPTSIEILDFSRNYQEEKLLKYDDLKDQIIWAQAYVIVYDICDERSFIRAQHYVKLISKIRGLTSFQAPIVLLGNKRDLEIGRKVNLEEGRSIAYKFGTQFYEVSAAENYVGVTTAFNGLIKEARSFYEHFNGSTTVTYQPGQAIKKLSLNSVTRAFGAVFGKNSPGASQYYTIIRDGRVSLPGEPPSADDKHRRSNSISQSNNNNHNNNNNSPPNIINSCKQKKETILETAHKRSPPIASL